MQVADMRAFGKLLSTRNPLFSLSSSHKPFQNPGFSFPRQFHPTRHLSSSDESTASSSNIRASSLGWSSGSNSSFPSTSNSTHHDPYVETFYDPVMGRVVTKRVTRSNAEEKRSSESSSESGRERNGNSGGDLSSFDFRDAGGTRVYGEVIGKKKGKSKIVWVCSECGYSSGQWWGYCQSCQMAGTMKQFSPGLESNSTGKVSGFEFSENVTRAWLQQKSADTGPIRLADVNRGISPLNWRIPLSGLFGAEVGRVLGGGLVPGSLVLVGGDPGIGKSTLLLQTAAIIAEGHEMGGTAPVVYVSGEESIEQIGNRADRMKIGATELFLYSSTDIKDILDKAQPLSPRAIVIDSIQTVYLQGVTGSAGSVSQVRECTSALLRFAKTTNVPVLLAGHVTKSGDIAGPRVLEHIVDVVLYMEGEKFSSYRLLRSVKNRFGTTDELGVFEMSQAGLQAVSNPSEMFLSEEHSDSEFLAGLAVAVIMDGSRAFLIEIQALCIAGSPISRQVNGVQASRADMIISVLMKQAGLKLQENGIFLNVVSGVNLSETAGDLSVAAAICSSFLEFPIPRGIAFIGEIGLGGELRMVPRMEKRVATLAKLGYKKCIVPESAEKFLSTLELERIQILGCRNLKEMINKVFRKG
ncbi:hypothetical protein ACH5RR_007997 [Cinchona calisaya]|uniref:RecA family profile 1 domain-containing protein n=1 Tax=Cinchona calisaya TaxID=153742 RepID=A0ABD3AE04_9GENT